MKQLIFLLTSLILLSFFIAVPQETQAQSSANCLRMDVAIDATNWPGGSVTLSCPGDNGPSGCSGSSVTGIPGQTVTLDKCSCPPFASGCLEASFPAQCQEEFVGGACGTNGNILTPTLKLTCSAPPGETPPPACIVGGTCGPNECSVIDCKKAYARKYDDNCNCVVDSSTQFDDDSCTQAVTCPAVTPSTTATPPVSTGTPPISTGTPPVTTGTPPVTTGTPPAGTGTPRPSPTPTISPTPVFSQAMCKCDGIDYSPLLSGQPVTIISYGKVQGQDTSKARIVDQKFFLAEGGETTATILQKSGPIPATIVQGTTGVTRYKSTWNLTLPQLKTGVTYRIWSQVNCQPKTTAVNYSPSTTSVLAESTQSPSLIDRILSFFNSLLGLEDNEQSNITEISSDVPSPVERESLQIIDLAPAEVVQNSCSFIKFRPSPNN